MADCLSFGNITEFISNTTILGVFFEARVLGQSLKSQALESHYLDLNPSSATYGGVIVDQGSCSAFYSLSSCKTQIIVAPRVIPCKALNQVKQVVGTQHYSSSFCH